VARPSQPIIQRDVVVRTALAIIDEVGIDDFGLERLAAELNVRAPSLYHHFRSKADILAEVARLVTTDVRVPDEPAMSRWPDWFVEIATRFRRSVLRHPNAAPLLVQFFPRRFTLATYERGARLLEQAGIPLEQHTVIFEGLDQLTFGAALIAAARRTSGNDDLYPDLDAEREPHLARSVAAGSLADEALFQESVRAYLRGFRSVRRPTAAGNQGSAAPQTSTPRQRTRGGRATSGAK
jgi:AcrR family transcriptional regulator